MTNREIQANQRAMELQKLFNEMHEMKDSWKKKYKDAMRENDELREEIEKLRAGREN